MPTKPPLAGQIPSMVSTRLALLFEASGARVVMDPPAPLRSATPDMLSVALPYLPLHTPGTSSTKAILLSKRPILVMFGSVPEKFS